MLLCSYGWARSAGVGSLQHLATGTEFVSIAVERPALWEIELRRGDGSIVTIGSANAHAELPRAAEGGPVTLRWQTELGVRVTVTVDWDEGRAFTRWRIRVDNASKDLGIWRVAFPILPGFGHPGRTDVATSYLHRNLRDRVTSPLWSWQFVPITCGRATLYVAMHDARHNHRELTFEPGKELRITTLPSEMGKPGNSYAQDHDTVIGAVEGDWYDAAQVYREWGLKQAWCRRGPVARWEGLPDGFRDTAIWLTAMSPLTKDPKAVVDTMLEAKRFFGVPVGVHWYNWYRRPFMPRLFPPREGVVEQIKRARAVGVTVMPYINMLYSGDVDAVPGVQGETVRLDVPARDAVALVTAGRE